jgi:hypothetical protein
MRPDASGRLALRYRDCVRIIGNPHRLGALTLSVLNTFLVFAVIPLGIVLVIASLAFVGGDRGQRRSRYRPGRPYDFQPVWFLASPEIGGTGSADDHTHALTQGESRPQLAPAVFEDSAGQRVLPGPTGGASDRW